MDTNDSDCSGPLFAGEEREKFQGGNRHSRNGYPPAPDLYDPVDHHSPFYLRQSDVLTVSVGNPRSSSATATLAPKRVKTSWYSRSRAEARTIREQSQEAELGETNGSMRSRATELNYLAIAKRLFRLSSEDKMDDPTEGYTSSPSEVIEYLDRSRDRLSSSSWNTYYHALLWYFERERNASPCFAISYEKLKTIERQPFENRKARATRAKRLGKRKPQGEGIPEPHFHRLLEVLEQKNRHVGWGARVQLWMVAGISTGLRPKEWFGTEWLVDKNTAPQTVLRVPNGKLKRKETKPGNRLAAGVASRNYLDKERTDPDSVKPGPFFVEELRYRDVPVDPDDWPFVEAHMREIRAHALLEPDEPREKRFEKYFNLSAKVLNSACHEAFKGKRLYGLYKMRGQYASNSKLTLSLEEVRKRMGHAEGSRVTEGSYGKRRDAFPSKRKAQDADGQGETPTDSADGFDEGGDGDRPQRESPGGGAGG